MPDYSKMLPEQGEKSSDLLTELVRLATEQEITQSMIEDVEKNLKGAKEKLKELQTITIPNLMKEIGLQSIKLQNGKTLTIEKKYFASIPKGSVAEAMAWLDENGYADTVKRVIQAQQPRDQQKQQELRDFLFDNEINFDINQTIHHSTLKKIVKDTMEAGKEIPIQAFGVYIENSSTIK